MRWLDDLKRALSNDSDGELGRADMIALAARGMAALARRDTKGETVFPPGVIVRITAKEGSLDTLRAWAADPATDAEVTARLVNERHDPAALPARRWVVERGEVDGLSVEEDAAPVLAVLVVEGGDHDGDRFPVGSGRKEWRIGRGRWHSDNRMANDIVLAESAAWLSRAAAVLRRGPNGLELESRDQGEFVLVSPRDGTARRPAMTASGRVVVGLGDRIEFHDGKDARIVLRVEAP